MTAAKNLLRRMGYTLRKGNARNTSVLYSVANRLRVSSFARNVENHFGETEEKRKEPFIPLNEGTLYGAGALQKNILALIPANKATISRALEAERSQHVRHILLFAIMPPHSFSLQYPFLPFMMRAGTFGFMRHPVL